jgi:hypothetical protein
VITLFLRLETDHELRQRCLDAVGRSGQKAIDLCGLYGPPLDNAADELGLARRILEDTTAPRPYGCSCGGSIRIGTYGGSIEYAPPRDPACPIHSGVRTLDVIGTVSF